MTEHQKKHPYRNGSSLRDNPGDWMIHCHIPEHMEAGMMSAFKII